MNKLLIVVSGGIVQAIHTNVKDLEICIADHDNASQGGNLLQRCDPDIVTDEPFYQQFTNNSDPTEMELRDELKRIHF